MDQELVDESGWRWSDDGLSTPVRTKVQNAASAAMALLEGCLEECYGRVGGELASLTETPTVCPNTRGCGGGGKVYGGDGGGGGGGCVSGNDATSVLDVAAARGVGTAANVIGSSGSGGGGGGDGSSSEKQEGKQREGNSERRQPQQPSSSPQPQSLSPPPPPQPQSPPPPPQQQGLAPPGESPSTHQYAMHGPLPWLEQLDIAGALRALVAVGLEVPIIAAKLGQLPGLFGGCDVRTCRAFFARVYMWWLRAVAQRCDTYLKPWLRERFNTRLRDSCANTDGPVGPVGPVGSVEQPVEWVLDSSLHEAPLKTEDRIMEKKAAYREASARLVPAPAMQVRFLISRIDRAFIRACHGACVHSHKITSSYQNI